TPALSAAARRTAETRVREEASMAWPQCGRQTLRKRRAARVSPFGPRKGSRCRREGEGGRGWRPRAGVSPSAPKPRRTPRSEGRHVFFFLIPSIVWRGGRPAGAWAKRRALLPRVSSPGHPCHAPPCPADDRWRPSPFRGAKGDTRAALASPAAP